jgi:hypothetical protein
MADSATRRLQALGLKRRTRRKTFNEIVAEIGSYEQRDDAGAGEDPYAGGEDDRT